MIERTELLPGIFLRAVESHRFKTGCFSLSLLSSLGETASANALFSSLPLRGTSSHPDLRAISNALDDLYGASVGTLVRKRGEVQSTGWYLDFLEDRYAPVPVFRPTLKLLEELVFSPLREGAGYSVSRFEGERCNLRNAIAADLNDKRVYATRQMLQTMCKEETYRFSRNGTQEQVDALTPEGLFQYGQELLATAPIELFYMGAQPQETVIEAVRELLAPLRRGQAAPLPKTQLRPAPEQVREVTEELPVSQSKLSMGFRTEPWFGLEDLAARIVFNVIYGGTNGKLFRVVREERSLCYYVSASYDRYKSIMAVSSGVSLEHVDTAREEILRQLELCQRGQITPEELDMAKGLLCSSVRSDMDNPLRIDEFSLGQVVAGMDYDQRQLLETLSRVTLEDVIRAARGVQPDTYYCLKGVGE